MDHLKANLVAVLIIALGSLVILGSRLQTEVVYGVVGEPVTLEADFNEETFLKVHSVTWKVEKAFARRILQYISEDGRLLSSTPYEGRVSFEARTSALTLLNYTRGDQGIYHILVTAQDGTETRWSVSLHTYDAIEGMSLVMEMNDTLKCAITRGTEATFLWLRDGERLREPEGQRVTNTESHSRLTLHRHTHPHAHPHAHTHTHTHTHPHTDCSIYTCQVSNNISQQLASLQLSDVTGHPPHCGARGRVALLVSVCVCVTCVIITISVSKMRLRVPELRRGATDQGQTV